MCILSVRFERPSFNGAQRELRSHRPPRRRRHERCDESAVALHGLQSGKGRPPLRNQPHLRTLVLTQKAPSIPPELQLAPPEVPRVARPLGRAVKDKPARDLLFESVTRHWK